MSKFFAYAACAAVCVLSVFTSCQKEVLSGQTSEERVTLTIDVTNPDTKVLSVEDEATVKNYQVFLFKDSGIIEDYVSQSSSKIKLDCTVGDKSIIVLVNGPAMGDIMDIDSFYARTSLLSDNTPDAFVMEGRQDVRILNTEGAYISIVVTRKVARVQLSSLSVEIDMPQYKNLPFKVQSVYLINVPAEMPYFETVESTLWYNKSGYVQEDYNDLTYDDMGDFEITAETPYEAGNVFYCYPNNVGKDSFDEEWCPRSTRLVVEATLGDEKYYYPVKLPKLEQNMRYEVNLVVTRPGCATPDSDIKKFAADFNITVNNWAIGSTIHKEI